MVDREIIVIQRLASFLIAQSERVDISAGGSLRNHTRSRSCVPNSRIPSDIA